MPQEFKHILEAISEKTDLTSADAEFALGKIVKGEVSSEASAAFLFGMRCKGETVSELTSFVKVMREASVRVEVNTDGAVDLCGTGGDGSGTFNISTAAMFVVAGAGVPVLKHGNRSVSSQCGSADVLEKLGADVTLGKTDVESVFKQTEMAFMFAPNFHPAMKHVMPARRALGIRTFFNILGPLLNPAIVKRQVIGAFDRDVAITMIRILENLGMDQAFTVHAMDGLDEVSTTATTELFRLQNGSGLDGNPASDLFDPGSLGIGLAEMKDLAGGGAARNADIIKSVLSGHATDAQRDIVLLNAAFGIYVSGTAGSLVDAAGMAAESIESGAADRKLNEFVQATRNPES